MNEYTRIFMESYGDSVFEPVEEGWGAFLYKFASFVLPRPINGIKAIASNLVLKKLLSDRDVMSYLKSECDRILAQERKKDPSITQKLPSDPITLIKRWWHNNDGVGFWSRPSFLSDSNNLLEDKIFKLGVGQYNVTFWYDSDHIDAAVVLLYSKDHNKCIGKRLKPPKHGDASNKIKSE